MNLREVMARGDPDFPGGEAERYLMQCCDCDLIHEMEVAIRPANAHSTPTNSGESREGLVVFRMRRAVATEAHDV